MKIIFFFSILLKFATAHKTNNISTNFAITAAAELKALNNSDTYQMSACDKDTVVDTGVESERELKAFFH